MNVRITAGLGALTDKEKQTLRLIVRGHDAKSVARELDLSVHTVNERLRDARRKMAVSSSREAARLLLDHEGPTPECVVPHEIGEARAATPPKIAAKRTDRRPAFFIGVIVMSLALAIFLLSAQPHDAAAPPVTDLSAQETAAVENAARQWLELLDQSRWDDSYKATASSFRKLNTAEVWARVSNKVRAPLGAMVSRTLLSHENLPAPPNGYEVVKFRTTFANKADAVETVSLDREGGVWRVVGVYVE